MLRNLTYTSPAPDSILALLTEMAASHNRHTYEEPLLRVTVPDGYLVQLAMEVAYLYPVGSPTRNALECLVNTEDLEAIRKAMIGTVVGGCLICPQERPEPEPLRDLREFRTSSGVRVVRGTDGTVRFLFPDRNEVGFSAESWDRLVQAMEVDHATA